MTLRSFLQKTKSVSYDNLTKFGLVANVRHPVIASLTARANAVKMLHARIQVLKSYLNALPLSYLTTAAPSSTSTSTDTEILPHIDTSTSAPEVNHPLLRSILALLSRLPLLLPPAHLSSFQHETLAEKSDVELVSLLGVMGRSVKEAREMGRKFGIVDGVRISGKKGYLSMGAMAEGWGIDDGSSGGQPMMDPGFM